MTNNDTAGKHRSAFSPSTRKTIFQMLIGGVTGAAAMLGLLALGEAGGAEFEAPDHLLALGTGAVYLLMGSFVGFGASLPKVGARLLNVEDEAEVRHDRRDLLAAAASMALIGVALIALALGAGDGSTALISRELSGIICAAAILGVIFLSIVFRMRQDELNRLLVTESAALTAYLLVALFGGWAIVAHLGIAYMFTPLAFVAGSLALFLLSIFIAAGRRGMLTPRAG